METTVLEKQKNCKDKIKIKIKKEGAVFLSRSLASGEIDGLHVTSDIFLKDHFVC